MFFPRLVLLFIFMSTVYAQEFPVTNQLDELWLSGQKIKILEIANNRLASDENDVLGLLLKLEYEIEFLELDKVEGTADKLFSVASQISAEEFANKIPRIELTVNRIRMAIPYYTPELLAEDLAKANIAGKPLGLREFIEALEKDGLLSNVIVQ